MFRRPDWVARTAPIPPVVPWGGYRFVCPTCSEVFSLVRVPKFAPRCPEGCDARLVQEEVSR